MLVTKLRRVSSVRKAHLLVGLLALCLVVGAQAHAMLVNSSLTDGQNLDAFPPELVLTFNESVGLIDGGMTLHGEGFDPIVLVPVATDAVVTIPLPTQGEGGYVVQWRVISADGHPIAGTVRFTVGASHQNDEIVLDTGLPAWIDVGHQVATGAVYFALLASLGTLLTGWLIAREDMRSLCRISQRLAISGIVFTCMLLPLEAMVRQGATFASAADLLRSIRELDWSLIALPLILLAAVGMVRYPLTLGVMLAASLAMLLLTGHTRSRDPMWLMMLSDGVHISVGAIWLGGLIVLTLGLSGRWFRSAFSTPNIPVARFSALAAWSVSALAITGGIMAWRILDSWDALFQTAYGQTLLIKVGVVLSVMAIAGVNRFWLLPRTSMTWLRKLVLAELVLLIVVTGVTGRLVNLDPNVQAATSAVLYRGQVDLGKGYLVELSVISDDDEITVTAQISDDMGMVVTPVESPVVAWSLDAQSLGPLNLELESTANGYEGAIILPVEGTWSMDISVRVDRFTELHTSLQIQTNP